MSESIRDIAEFTSATFAPVLPDDCQVNPHTYGFELAWWLCKSLMDRDAATSYPLGEDWGWFIEFTSSSGAEFAVHCGNVVGTEDRWLLSLRRHGRKMFGRDKPSFEEANELVEAIKALLTEEASVTELDWQFS